MIVSIASGKGGTGKTTIACALAQSAEGNVCFLDCDVEEPNAHFFLKPATEKAVPVRVPVPVIDESKCNGCGKCAAVCEYRALLCLGGKPLLNEKLCHGCGGCVIACPTGAISEKDRNVGLITRGRAGPVSFVSGELNIGEAMPVPVIRALKKSAPAAGLTIIDAPPGTSCSMVESVKGSDFCILVTEPTPFGLYDLSLAVEVMRGLKIPFAVIVNRSDLGDSRVDEYCRRENIPLCLKVPFDRSIAEAYSRGISLVEHQPAYRESFKKVLREIQAGAGRRIAG